MNRFFIALIFVCGLTACGMESDAARTPTLPAFSPVALAQTTNAPTPTDDPRHTRTPTAVALQTPQPPTQTIQPSPSPTLAAPAVLGHIELLDLSGEGRDPEAMAQVNDVTYVANRGTNNLALLRQDRITKFLPLDVTPWALAADAAHNRVYVGTYLTPTLLLIENEQVVKQTAANARVNALAVHGNDLYVARDDDAIIERYDANTLTKKDELILPDAFAVNALAVDAPRNRLYAGIYEKIVAIDLTDFRELFRMEVPGLYARFAVNPQDGSIWSGAYDGESSRAYILGNSSDGKEIARLDTGHDVTVLTFDNANRLYALDRYRNQLLIVHAPDAKLTATLAMNQSPSDAVFDPQRNSVLVSNADSDNVVTIDTATATVTNTIPLASNINALAANPQRNRVYAASGSTNSVVVVENDKVIGQVPTGNNPLDLAVDPSANRVYVAASADGTLTVIDEDTLRVVERQFITSTLTTVAVDSVQQKIFAGSYLLNPGLETQTTFFARGLTLDSKTIPQFERVNSALSKLYAIAGNGVPGSNSRVTLYRFLYDAWDDPKLLGSKNGGNTTALAIDPTTNNLYATNTHPLAFTYGLDVFDAQDQLVQSFILNSHTADMVVNPTTHHLFLAHPPTTIPVLREPKPEFNTVEILDTRTLGRVASLDVPNAPWRLTRLQDKIYVVGQRDGVLTILGDAAVSKPPAPTPTLTPTPFPTWTPAPNVAPTATTAPSANITCSFGPPPPFAELWLQYIAELGCPTDVAADGNFAVQTFKDGYMFDDLRNPNAQKIYVLFPDKTFAVYDDTWRDEGQTDRPCNDVEIPEGRVHPKRGFGKVWCEHLEIQAKLPGAIADESGITLSVQDFERGMMWANTPRGVIMLFRDGTWK